MKKRSFGAVVPVLVLMMVLITLLCLMERTTPSISRPAQAAPPAAEPTVPAPPLVIAIDPTSAYNDLDTTVVITGSAFADGAAVLLGDTALDDVDWVSSATLSTTVPWGLAAGVYTVTVVNPDGRSGSLPSTFTVTQGIGVWNAAELYGGWGAPRIVNPVTPTTIYALTTVGLFRSRDGGGNWSYVLTARGEGGVVLDSYTNRLYVGGFCSLWRSHDEGDHWTELQIQFPFTETEPARCHRDMRPYVHPDDGAVVYAVACGRCGPSGLVRSTDHGETWTSLMSGITDTQVTALAFDPDDPLTMYAGTANGHVFRSTEGGEAWIYASTPVSHVRDIVVNPFDSDEVWANGDDWFGDPGTLVKSTNDDLTAWMEVEPAPDETVSAFVFAPTIPGTMFAVSGGRIHKSTDGGDTWTVFNTDGAVCPDIPAFHPTDPDIMYLGDCWEAVYKTTDGGQTWQVANQGLTAISPRQLEIVSDRPDIVFAVVDPGRLFRATQGGEVWQRLPITGVSCILVDPVTTTRVYAGVGDRVYVSNDRGNTWPTYSQLDMPAYVDYSNFPAILLAVPGQPGTVLAGVSHISAGGGVVGKGSIYRSTDAGLSWDRVYPIAGEIGQIADIAYDREITAVVYAGTWGSGLHRSTDSGQTWQRIGEDVEALDNAASIAPEPHAPYRLVVTTDAEHGVYRSPDHGLTWTKVSPRFGGWPLRWTPEYPSRLYVPTEYGLWRSVDGGESWQVAAGALGQLPVYSLATATTEDRVILYAGTTGGYVEGSAGQVLSQADTEGTLVNAGVYRYTARRLTERVYLSLVLRGYTP